MITTQDDLSLEFEQLPIKNHYFNEVIITPAKEITINKTRNGYQTEAKGDAPLVTSQEW